MEPARFAVRARQKYGDSTATAASSCSTSMIRRRHADFRKWTARRPWYGWKRWTRKGASSAAWMHGLALDCCCPYGAGGLGCFWFPAFDTEQENSTPGLRATATAGIKRSALTALAQRTLEKQ